MGEKRGFECALVDSKFNYNAVHSNRPVFVMHAFFEGVQNRNTACELGKFGKRDWEEPRVALTGRDRELGKPREGQRRKTTDATPQPFFRPVGPGDEKTVDECIWFKTFLRGFRISIQMVDEHCEAVFGHPEGCHCYYMYYITVCTYLRL